MSDDIAEHRFALRSVAGRALGHRRAPLGGGRCRVRVNFFSAASAAAPPVAPPSRGLLSPSVAPLKSP
jgi:hypothetical protein